VQQLLGVDEMFVAVLAGVETDPVDRPGEGALSPTG
jgi:hypothetical protein